MSDRDYREFRRQLPTLLEKHLGEYAVFHRGELVDTFPDLDTAATQAYEQFGLDETFFVEQILPPEQLIRPRPLLAA